MTMYNEAEMFDFFLLGVAYVFLKGNRKDVKDHVALSSTHFPAFPPYSVTFYDLSCTVLRPCHCPGGLSPASHGRVPGSTPDQSIWDMWNTECRWDQMWIFSTDVPRSSRYQILRKSIQQEQRWYMPRDGWTDGQAWWN